MNRIESIKPADRAAMKRAEKKWNSVAKPLHSLGIGEEDVIKLAGIFGTENFSLDKRCAVIMCADNGVVCEGVTQTDSSVTGIVAKAIAEGTSNINTMARVYNARKSECLPISGRDVLLMTQISFFDDPVRCAEMCNRLADELEQRIKDGVSVVPEGTKRILVTGTPMAVPNWKLHNIIETSGAAVVCEEMCTGTRYFENLVDETKTTLDDQFMALSERYMKTNCACFTPNNGRIDDLLRMVKEYKVDGVIDCSLKFCCLYDTEKYSVARALKEAGVPVLGLETDYTDTDAEQLRTRIGAFIEMLNNR